MTTLGLVLLALTLLFLAVRRCPDAATLCYIGSQMCFFYSAVKAEYVGSAVLHLVCLAWAAVFLVGILNEKERSK